MESEIYKRIPHRPPFLWIDSILSLTSDKVVAEKHIPEDLELFNGHYPDHPLMPGVLLCESVFQAGAILISENIKNNDQDTGVPVLTRIYGARFKREVPPGARIQVHVRLTERIGSAWLMKGKVQVAEKTAVTVEFGCAMSG